MFLDRLVRAIGIAHDNLVTTGDDVIQAFPDLEWKTRNMSRAADEDRVH